jgi:hypothetical protein
MISPPDTGYYSTQAAVIQSVFPWRIEGFKEFGDKKKRL